jgi:hypothetical protein
MRRFWGWVLSVMNRAASLVAACLLIVLAVPVGMAVGAVLVPWILCQRWRAGRWLPVFGPVYYAALVLVVSQVGGISWGWAVAGWMALLVLCFPPDPYTFFFRPRLRRATFRALDRVERGVGLSVEYVEYERVSIESEEPGLVIVRVGIGRTGVNAPQTRRFLVRDDGDVEQLPVDDEPQPAHPDDRPFA